MSCSPTPTATQYATITTFTTSTSYSQSGANNQPQMTTVVQQSCVASGTISGSSTGCISSAEVTQVNTVAGGGQAAQVPIVVTLPITETQPTKTLYADCTDGAGQSANPTPPPSPSPADNASYTTSFLVESTPPPSTVVEATSTTLSDGSVVETIVTFVSTLPVTGVYEPSTVPNPSLQSDAPQGSGTDVAPIVGGVLGGFLGLIAIVGSLWWLCRRRRSWDDIFEKEAFDDEDPWATPIPVRRERDRSKLDLSAEPKPYQYGLVGHVVPPAASGSPPSSPRVSGSLNRLSMPHSRNTSYSATPLLQATPGRASRPSTAGSMQTVQTRSTHRAMSAASSTEMGPRSLSMLSTHSTSSTAPLIDTRASQTPVALNTWIPNTDMLAALDPVDRTGSPVIPTERRILQIANDGPPSPTTTIAPITHTKIAPLPHASGCVLVHTDGGRVAQGSNATPSKEPPAYSR
ncbi:hypothetical protein HYDPIDRAFT_105798 [Hydnomerulius pinastri MD-312]|nr:hypothetical protein HYDPIDRAFT_105798 [Hydnomerulius pinastri MD-312]